MFVEDSLRPVFDLLICFKIVPCVSSLLILQSPSGTIGLFILLPRSYGVVTGLCSAVGMAIEMAVRRAFGRSCLHHCWR